MGLVYADVIARQGIRAMVEKVLARTRLLYALTVYTIVNVITVNLPDVQHVQLLVDGREVDTLAGHVDLRRPLRKNEDLIQQ